MGMPTYFLTIHFFPSLAIRYHPWSFLNSPGWIGLKCELRTLSQFSFTLNPDWELKLLKQDKIDAKNGVRDMLVKHHLFSWNL